MIENLITCTSFFVIMLVPISLGELIDKITILEIKKENFSGDKLNNVEKELDSLLKFYNEMETDELFLLKSKLLEVNKKLWKIEDDLREKERNKEFDQEFIELARAVYFTNDERSRIKKDINLLTNSEFIEEKGYEEY